MFIKLEDNQNFSDTFSNYIIAYCPDTDSFFCTNQRYFFYEFEKEFENEKQAIKYFENHIDLFKSIRMNVAISCGGINKNGKLFLENTKKFY